MDTLEWPIAAVDEWSVVEDGTGSALDKLEPAGRTAIEKAAIEHLFRWTGGIFGLRPATIRPCWRPGTGVRQSPWAAALYAWKPVTVDGKIWGLSCGCGSDYCRCDSPAAIRFPFRVESIVTVRIDGFVLPADAYRLDNHRILIRHTAPWPVTQNLDLPDTEPGTWSVALKYGAPVPQGGQVAAALLAEEMAKAIFDDTECRLPQRIQTITRQGITVGMIDSMDDLEAGRTGIWLVDSWIAAVNSAPTSARVRSVDIPTTRFSS